MSGRGNFVPHDETGVDHALSLEAYSAYIYILRLRARPSCSFEDINVKDFALHPVLSRRWMQLNCDFLWL